MAKTIGKILGPVAALAMMATSSSAATVVGSLAVTATVVDTCLVASTPLAFATINTAVTTDEVAPAVITVTCTSSKTGVTVALDGGNNEDSGQRRMTDGSSNYLPYNIHSDSGHASAVAVDANIFSGNITAATPELINVYGQVPSGSYAFGAYTDSVVITVTYP